jgi:hypothetical protein
MTDQQFAALRAARMELAEVRNPPPQVRDAIKRLDDVLAYQKDTPA